MTGGIHVFPFLNFGSEISGILCFQHSNAAFQNGLTRETNQIESNRHDKLLGFSRFKDMQVAHQPNKESPIRS